MSYSEDDSSWDTDLVLNSNMISRFSPRRNFDPKHVEKEMLLACQRSMMMNSSSNSVDPYDDDTNSSLSSFMSDDKYSLDDPLPHPNPLDEFMYNTIPPLTFDDHQLPGVVKRLGGRNNRTEDDGDWATDISFSPSTLLKTTERTKKNEYYSNLTIDDVEVNNDSLSTKVPERKKEEVSHSSPQPASFVIVPENFEDANDLSDLEFSNHFSNSPLMNMKRKLQEAELNQKKKESNSSLLDLIEKEEDEEDFCKDLEINEVFTQKSRLLNTKKTTAPASASVTPSTPVHPPNMSSPSPSSPSSSSSKPTKSSRQTPQSSKSRFQKGTIASRQREMTVAAERIGRSPSKSSDLKPSSSAPSLRKKAILKQAISEPPPAKKTSPTGTTLITRPLGKSVYGGNSRLDTLDNLVDIKPKKTPTVVKKVVIKNQNVDPQRPWRNNMTKRQPVLIQPQQNTSRKDMVVDNMTYDKNQRLWKGNETALNDFNEKPVPRRKPLLISNKQKNKPGAAASKYTSATVNGMVFKEDTLQWVKPAGEAEDNTLDAIEDLKVGGYTRRPRNILSDFAISATRKQEMIEAEKNHNDWVKYWPIAKNEKMVMTRSGHKVGASKYMLF